MMPFSIRTGLERVEVVGSELGLLLGRSAGSESRTPLEKQKKGGSARASPVAASIPKSVLP